MDLDELQSVRDRERQTDKLQQLRETFYADAGEFIQALRDQRERAAERADDPFDAPEVSRLSDEIDTAEQTVEAIYEKRVGKIVKAASFAAADLPAESDGMTAEETDLFETLVDDIKQNRQHVLDVLAGEADSTASEETSGESGAASEGQRTPPAESEPQATGSTSAADDHAPEVIGVETEVSAADVMGSGPDTGADLGSPDAAGADPDASDADGVGPGTPDATGGPDATGDTGHSPTEARGDGGSQPAPPAEDQPTAGAASGESGGPGGGQGQHQAPPETGAGGARLAHETEAKTASQDAGETPETTVQSAERVRQESETASVARETVRITAEVGDIFGVDQREYDLSTDDVVRLPADNVDPLVERDAAERL